MNQTANSGVRENKLSNNIQQPSSMTMPGNPDVKFPPQSGNAIPYSENGKITGWTPINGSGILIVENGSLSLLPILEGVMVGNGMSITFKQAPSGGLSLFNNSYGWTGTENCT